MAKIATFRDLIAWQRAMDLAEQTHRASQSLPSTERFEMASQLRRSATSIPANVAEGFSRKSRAAYRSHVAIALGSNAERQTHLEVCRRLALLVAPTVSRLEELALEVARLLYGLWRSLRPKAVGYAGALLLLFVLGLWPLALGLFRGLSFFP